MSESGFASLNPSLLARKGGAKPAMRPQLGPIPNEAAVNLEDLGWNDMGHEHDHGNESAVVVPLTPHAANEQGELVIRRHAASVGGKPAARAQSGVEPGKRAAFTLRLDAQRHLKLRLASTISNRSAQQIVTEALDALLAEIDDLDSLAARLQRG
ncbi:MAG: hypothetical protein A3J40_01875 [Erythrobacter sp. RIFCSPHIGHO2_12_FULL_63_10]|nr:MAG: hypothetical protein A3J40_01875 [Erythrobacter sp. RIFCSPHIGHO2_12_FULL_63_10]